MSPVAQRVVAHLLLGEKAVGLLSQGRQAARADDEHVFLGVGSSPGLAGAPVASSRFIHRCSS